jgi:hypothetical protein
VSAVAVNDLVRFTVLIAVDDSDVHPTVAVGIKLKKVGFAIAVGVDGPQVGFSVLVRIADNQLDTVVPAGLDRLVLAHLKILLSRSRFRLTVSGFLAFGDPATWWPRDASCRDPAAT